MKGLTWDPSLIQRYNMHGPRYTSYPTALALAAPFNEQGVLDALAGSHDRLSVYIHLPFCHKLCYYCGCNKVITRHQGKASTYLDALEEEIKHYQPLIAHRGVGALHLGGGTPTFLTEEQLTRLMVMLETHLGLDVNSGHEISIEIDPRSCSLKKLEHVRHLGFNRVSYGVQDLDARVQIAINRVQDEPMLYEMIERSRALGFNSINLDLIYGLPLQTPETFKYTLDKTIEWSPDRISLFSYAHIPSRFASQRKIKEADMPTPDVKLSLLKQGIEAFTGAGYQFIGMDHFAKPEDELAVMQREGRLQRNFQGYTTHGSDTLIGFGSTSISQVNGVIWQNEKELSAYYARCHGGKKPVVKGVHLTQDDKIRADLIAEIICHFKLDTAAFAQKWGIQFESYFTEAIKRLLPFINDGLVTYQGGVIQVNEVGRLLVRSICTAFDAYYKPAKPDEKSAYSKVI